MEEIYIGTKIIAAEPMSRHHFLDSTGQIGLKDHVHAHFDEDRPGYKVRYEDGYVSWRPKETFDTAYRKMTLSEVCLIETEGKTE